MRSYDVIIIGGGFLGLSAAYQLSRMGVRTLVLEAGEVGSGTSGASSGRAQVCEGHLDPFNLMLIREGIKRHETLEEELGASYEWRRTGIILLLRDEPLRNHWLERAAILTGAGIPTEVIDLASLREAEPNLNMAGYIGAAYSVEGMMDPLKFTHVYANAARRCGAVIERHSPVVSLEVENHRVIAVKTATDTYTGDVIAVMAGAWSPVVTRMAGVEVPVHHTHAEAIITEPIPPMIYHNVEPADFYEIIHGKLKAVAIGIKPEPNGTLDITEAVTRTTELHKRVSPWGICSISKQAVDMYPFLSKVRVVRSWGRPTSFTPDEEPLVGWIPQLDNLFIATSLVETITTLPLLSEWMALMIQRKNLPVSLDGYSPARFSNGWTWN